MVQCVIVSLKRIEHTHYLFTYHMRMLAIMRMHIVKNQIDGSNTVSIEHHDAMLLFNITTYSKTSERSVSVNTATMFNEFNQYVATLTDEAQGQMFTAYQNILEIFERRGNLEHLTVQIIDQVALIYQHLKLDRIRAWIIDKSTITIPASLTDYYNENETKEYQARTYLRTHYIDLAALALALRAMVPIWGQYIHIGEQSSGSQMKEYIALQLLYKTGINQSDPFIRLGSYIQFYIDSNSGYNTSKAAPILTALGTADMQLYLLAKTIVRRLCIGELSSSNEQTHIVTNLFQYIFNGVRDLDRKFSKTFGGKIKDKKETIRNSKGGEEQSVSVAEMYKIVQPISDGDVVMLNVYTEYMEPLALKIEPGLNLDYLYACLHAISALEKEAILPHHVVLTQWMCHRVFSPKAGQSMNKASMLRLMSIVQAILWHWEMYDLAGLATATKINQSNMMGFGYNETRIRIKNELADELAKMTPHYQQPKSRQANVRNANPANKSIEAFSALISYSDWQLHCPSKLMGLVSGRVDRTNRFIIPGDIKIKLCQLLMKINQGMY